MKKVFASLFVLTLIFSAIPALASPQDYLNNLPSWIDSGMNALSSGNSSSFNSGGDKDFKGILNIITNSILNPLVVLFLGIAMIYFMWGVLTYVRRGESEGDRAKGIQMMTYGIIAIFVMVSVWGLVSVLINTFDLNTSAPPIPALQ